MTDDIALDQQSVLAGQSEPAVAAGRPPENCWSPCCRFAYAAQ
jgi:hypothetical protein